MNYIPDVIYIINRNNMQIFSFTHRIVYKVVIRAGAEPTETVLFSDAIVLDNWNNQSIPKGNFGVPSPGAIVRLYFSGVGSDNQIQIFPGDWGDQLITDHHFYDDESLKIPVPGPLYMDFTLTEEMIHRMLNPEWGSAIMVIQGDQITITKITLLQY